MLIPSFILMYLIITKQSKLSSYFSKNALEKLDIKLKKNQPRVEEIYINKIYIKNTIKNKV